MRATILAPGSRGDVQPYVALGQALQSLGHECTIVTTLDHEELVRAYGLNVVTLPVNVAEELRRAETSRALEGGGLVSSFRQFAEIAKRAAGALARMGLEASRGSDVLVTGFSTALVADGISKKLGVPVVQAFNVPVTTTSAFPGALFPGLDFGSVSRGISHRLTRAALWLTARASANEACVQILGAEPASLIPPTHAGLLPGPVLYGFSEAFLPRPPEWGRDVHVTGFWFVEEASTFTPPADLSRFLKEGPPPVCVGFGSMSTESPQEVSAVVVDAAKAAGVRLVLLSGWAGLQPEALSGDVIALGGVPHSWLYPRCGAVVHHGGAGTTAAAVRAGVPAIVVPFHGDQPFWASRVYELGIGPPPVPRGELTAGRLASAIRLATTSDALRDRASAIGRRVREEHGALRAAHLIAERAEALAAMPFTQAGARESTPGLKRPSQNPGGGEDGPAKGVPAGQNPRAVRALVARMAKPPRGLERVAGGTDFVGKSCSEPPSGAFPRIHPSAITAPGFLTPGCVQSGSARRARHSRSRSLSAAISQTCRMPRRRSCSKPRTRSARTRSRPAATWR